MALRACRRGCALHPPQAIVAEIAGKVIRVPWVDVKAVVIDLGRAGQYSWRLQLALEEAFELVKEQEDFSPLARPGVLDSLAKIGGRGSRNAVLQMLLDRDRSRR